MQSKTKSSSQLAIFTLAIGFAFINSAFTWTFQNWQLMVTAQQQQEEAVKVAPYDLEIFAKKVGITFNVPDDHNAIKKAEY